MRSEHPRGVGSKKVSIISETVEQLKKCDIIKPSNLKLAFPVVLVNQNGKWRLCVHYRKLNSVTPLEPYTMLHQEDVFDALSGQSVFSRLDAVRGYYQIPIREEEHWKTAFTYHEGLY